MPKNPKIKKVLVLGSGPIVIGQAAEFDYAGTQACRALKEEGVEVVLVNSNPATIMTDKDIADHVYIEPLNLASVEQVIAKERPDSILPTLGGQTGLNLAMNLHEQGILEKYGVRLLGTSPESIRKAEDRQGFKDAMEAIGQPCVTSDVVESVEAAVEFAGRIGYPVIVRPIPWGAPAAASPTTSPPCGRSPTGASTCPGWARCSSSGASPAGRRSSSRSCGTPPATSSRSALWRTSTPWASTPATPSWWPPPRPWPTGSTKCSAPPP